MPAYLFNGLDEWYKKQQVSGLKSCTKKKSSIPMTESKKEKAWVTRKLPSNIHYGEQPNRNQKIAKEYVINGHTIKLWDNGLLSCDCKGWIFKRSGVQRECTHCREIYGQLVSEPKPEKTIKPSVEEQIALKILELLEGA